MKRTILVLLVLAVLVTSALAMGEKVSAPAPAAPTAVEQPAATPASAPAAMETPAAAAVVTPAATEAVEAPVATASAVPAEACPVSENVAK